MMAPMTRTRQTSMNVPSSNETHHHASTGSASSQRSTVPEMPDVRSVSRGGGSCMGGSNLLSAHNNENTVNEETDSRIINVGDKIVIEPDGDTFKLGPIHVVRSISRIIKTKFEKPWPSWKKVDVSVLDMWFEQFKKKYYWHPKHARIIKSNFETRGCDLLKSMLLEARKKLELDEMPPWLTSTVWDGLKTYWKSDGFKKKSEIGKANRNTTGVGSSRHTGGSIPTAEIRRRLEKKKR